MAATGFIQDGRFSDEMNFPKSNIIYQLITKIDRACCGEVGFSLD